MARGRPLAVLKLQEEDRYTLTRWSRRPKTAQALAPRACIVLATAKSRPNEAIAVDLAITPHTVGKWCRRYLERGPDGLLDEPRPGAPRTIGDDRVEAVIVRTMEHKPARRDPLVDALDGPGGGPEPELGQPHLVRVRAAALLNCRRVIDPIERAARIGR
ncbi:MAG: helix-turn-helix domain-containing protein [Chloroflexi bacterium]|nr:helix-turn-helix domain-containing protein [Chloroflexota bacterium]